jgi:conjugal transfer pilus assembly protein TraV
MKLVWLVACVVLLTGCSVTGTDSKAQFGCAAPEGVQCMTTSGVYYNSLANNLPAQRTASKVGANATVRAEAAPAAGAMVPAAGVPVPPWGLGHRAPDVEPAGAVRAAPRIVRVWVLPWEDADGDLHDQSYLYMTLDSGRWLVKHTRSAVQARKAGTTSLLLDESHTMGTPPGELPVDGRSTFAREMEKLAPATADAPRQ